MNNRIYQEQSALTAYNKTTTSTTITTTPTLSGQTIQHATTGTEAKTISLKGDDNIKHFVETLQDREISNPITIEINEVHRYMMQATELLFNVILTKQSFNLTSLSFGHLYTAVKLSIPSIPGLTSLHLGNTNSGTSLTIKSQPNLTSLTLGAIHDFSNLCVDASKTNFPNLTSFFHGGTYGNDGCYYNLETLNAIQRLAQSNVPTVNSLLDAFDGELSNPVIKEDLNRCFVEYMIENQKGDQDQG